MALLIPQPGNTNQALEVRPLQFVNGASLAGVYDINALASGIKSGLELGKPLSDAVMQGIEQRRQQELLAKGQQANKDAIAAAQAAGTPVSMQTDELGNVSYRANPQTESEKLQEKARAALAQQTLDLAPKNLELKQNQLSADMQKTAYDMAENDRKTKELEQNIALSPEIRAQKQEELRQSGEALRQNAEQQKTQAAYLEQAKNSNGLGMSNDENSRIPQYVLKPGPKGFVYDDNPEYGNVIKAQQLGMPSAATATRAEIGKFLQTYPIRTEAAKKGMADWQTASDKEVSDFIRMTDPSQKMNQDQSNSLGFAKRMEINEDAINNIPNFNPADKSNAFANSGWEPNMMMSKENQLYISAKKNWIAAQLRKESGSAIGKQEYEDGNMQYFPQPGDDPSVVKHKALLRKQAQESMRLAAGPAYASSPITQSKENSNRAKISTEKEFNDLPSGSPFDFNGRFGIKN